jgi:hypothetical protein
MRKVTINFLPNGEVRYVADDCLAVLEDLGTAHIQRASHVEPAVTPEGICWTADLSPVRGPVLGPFKTRQEALDEEHQWLDAHISKL